MATTSLAEIVSGLYEIVAAPESPASPPVFAYYLTAADASPAVTITLAATWNDPGLVGWYLFVGTPIPESRAAAFVARARAGLPSLTGGANPRTLVWLATPDPSSVTAVLPLYQIGDLGSPRTPVAPSSPGGSSVFDWSPLSLTIDSGVAVTLVPDAATLSIVTDAASPLITLTSAGRQPNWYSFYENAEQQWTVTLALAGDGAGGFQTTLGLDFGVLLADYGCDLRYWLPNGSNADEQLTYPFCAPQALGRPQLGFRIGLHPLLPTDPDCTRFTLDCGDGSPSNPFQTHAAALRAPSFLTTTGSAITLAPSTALETSPAGFAFCLTPVAGSPGTTQLYLAPSGTYVIAAIDGPAASPETGTARWMCGLSGLEYLEVAVGGRVGFQPGMPARMTRGSGDGPILDPTSTTAWIRYPLDEGTNASDGPCRYFGQPSASVYYASVATGAVASPVRSLLATLARPAIFPVAPYGLVSTPSAGYAVLESGALTGARHAALTASSTGPIFLPPDASPAPFAGGRDDAAAAPATAQTKQGFVVTLNADGEAAGTWERIDFAQSPEIPQQLLSVAGAGSPSVVPAGLATQLMQDELFLVVSDARPLGAACANTIAIAGFTFTLDVGLGGQVDGNSTILIFKYDTTTALRDLVRDKARWATNNAFVTDRDGTEAQIAAAFTAAGVPSDASRGPVDDGASPASPSVEDPFAAFRAIVADPAWTGVIALNCAIDGNAMPGDLQMLLGGIDGQLRAHHLGLQGNTVDSSSGTAVITASSLFGVISYPTATRPVPPPDPGRDFAYELVLLTVVFLNSKIQDFKARVGLTINRLFGRAVALTSGPAGPSPASPQANTLEIQGRYQLKDGVATVTFASASPFFYAVPVPDGTARVLRQVAFDSAALVPVVSDPSASPSPHSPDLRQVKARFNLAGALWFHRAPFAQAPDFDLFSFGAEPADAMKNGLGFTGFAVDVTFTLDASGGVAGPPVVTGDLSALSLAPGSGAVRPGSLLAGLPLRLSRLIADEAGFTAASLGAAPVHVLQLEAAAAGSPGAGSPSAGSPSAGSPAPSPAASPLAQAPNVTAAPQYGLEFDMPLGTLGALSSVSVGLVAKLVIGWGASRLVPGTDAAAVLVQLPQAFAGYGSFQLQGILKTVFGDANLLMVERDDGPATYALMFNNVQLSVLGHSFPPGVVIDFLVFAGGTGSRNDNLAWFLGATGTTSSPASPS